MGWVKPFPELLLMGGSNDYRNRWVKSFPESLGQRITGRVGQRGSEYSISMLNKQSQQDLKLADAAGSMEPAMQRFTEIGRAHV